MPSLYLYMEAEIAYRQLDELIAAGFYASVRRWDGSGQYMIAFNIEE